MKQLSRADLNILLSKHGLSAAMIVTPDDPCGWLIPFESEALGFCENVGAHFTFVEDQNMQAVAIQDEGVDIVAICAGMFWMLCRLASVVADSGVFSAMRGGNEPTWKPDLLKSCQSPRKIGGEGTPFNSEQESAGWRSYPERQILFYATLSVLFRFVLFHEIGHLQNDHGRRRAIRPSPPMLIDAMNAFLLEPEDAIPAQTREIVADSFSLKRVLEILDYELHLKADLEMTRTLRDKLMPDQEAMVRFVFIVIYLYFRLSDRLDRQDVSIDCLSHPPAPFRLRALMAALLEHRHLNISGAAAMQLVMNVKDVGDAVMSVVLGIYPNTYWFETASTPKVDQHFERLFHECPNWSGLSRDITS